MTAHTGEKNGHSPKAKAVDHPYAAKTASAILDLVQMETAMRKVSFTQLDRNEVNGMAQDRKMVVLEDHGGMPLRSQTDHEAGRVRPLTKKALKQAMIFTNVNVDLQN